MINHFSKTENSKRDKRATFNLYPNKKRAESQSKSFETVFASILHRKDNDFCTLESPHLNQQIEDLRPIFDDPCRTALSTPISRVPLAQERKKYISLKQKIEATMLESSKKNFSSLRELFNEKQSILTGFLNDFTNQIERQCKEKGDILKYIWNTMLNMIESISENVSLNMRSKEKCQLENNLRSHIEYQGLLEGYQKKQVLLNQKCRVERVTINSLVYELRFKRKEVNKLYRNQKLLVNKLNEYKSDNLNLQSSYIDLMCSLRDVPPEKVVLLLKAREEIHKSRQVKFKISSNRKNTKNQIKAELSNDKIEDLQNLYEEIKEIANSQVSSPQLISTLIQASIENFGLKNDDTCLHEQRLTPVPQKITKISSETQTNEYYIGDKTKSNYCTQFGYIERLTAQFINHRDTQTYCQYPKKKLLINVATDINQQEMNTLIAKKFTIIRSCQQSFLFEVNSQFHVKQGISIQKRHKKHSSDANLSRKSLRKSIMVDALADFIQEKDDLKSSSDESIELPSKKGQVLNNKRMTKLKKTSGKNMNLFPKERLSSATSNSSIKISNSLANLQSDQTVKKSHFGPSSPTFQDLNTTNQKTSQKKFSQSKEPRNSRDSTRKVASIMTPKFTKPREDISRNTFLDKNNYFNIEIDAVKEQEINNMFSNNDYAQMELSDEEAVEQLELENAELENMERLRVPDASALTEGLQKDGRMMSRKSSTMSAARSAMAKRQSQSVKYQDQNQLLINMCRLSYNKSHKKFKEKISIFKYHDEFTCVRDKIQFVARDVKNLIIHKQAILKKTINNKNIKNIYKILMMTFSKAYDAYNKGILKGNLIYPLFQSFNLVYGAINNNQIYKKMINFIASLAVCRENAILRFFLFFLGLDTMSPYSQKVTISEVYLCLKLLQKISVDGKVTLNIQSIYTDTTKIKQQLINILQQQKIPQALSHAIETRVQKQLQNSQLYKSSTGENSHLKLNIYNIILLIIQEVIKCKNTLKETFIPILTQYQQYQHSKKLPVYIIEVILSDWRSSNFQPLKLKSLIDMITKNGKRETVTIEQFCSILFECNLVSIDQIYQRSEFVYKKNWRIPHSFVQELQIKQKNDTFSSQLERREAEMFFKISSLSNQQLQENPTIQKMRRVIFEKHYERRVEQLAGTILGELWQLGEKRYSTLE